MYLYATAFLCFLAYWTQCWMNRSFIPHPATFQMPGCWFSCLRKSKEIQQGLYNFLQPSNSDLLFPENIFKYLWIPLFKKKQEETAQLLSQRAREDGQQRQECNLICDEENFYGGSSCTTLNHK